MSLVALNSWVRASSISAPGSRRADRLLVSPRGPALGVSASSRGRLRRSPLSSSGFFFRVSAVLTKEEAVREGEEGEKPRSFDFKGYMMEEGLPLDAVCWTFGYARGGFLAEAFLRNRRMLGEGITAEVVSYTSLMDGFSRLPAPGKAVGFLAKMSAEGIEPTAVTRTAAMLGLHPRAVSGILLGCSRLVFATHEEMLAGFVGAPFS